MSSAMMRQIADTETVLRRAIFEGTEVKVPTCFVILNQKLGEEEEVVSAAATMPAAVQARIEKARRWTNSLTAVFNAGIGSNIITFIILHLDNLFSVDQLITLHIMCLYIYYFYN
jgi:hypothetical protein